ncbi:hypothetical protein MAPG_02143 [Magnaporthiopsis poae ATCC 64411]|uniref:Uncharacterized protein n=1 Tax=Magnaporthiopsis poae (strain ATCC 64411 / 73-15) TaxID=644358 RepID=A0A0C4DQJ9_MAGP6|nr:hypothetical protein MAPG_02143 [Magnaporthiopsis poae ATCC 64411]
MRFSVVATIFFAAIASATPSDSPSSSTSSPADDDSSNTLIHARRLLVGENNLITKRATIRCTNSAPIKKDKAKFAPGCQHTNRRRTGRPMISAHNCKNDGGRSYLCVQSGVATCYTIQQAQKQKLEYGQCFM